MELISIEEGRQHRGAQDLALWMLDNLKELKQTKEDLLHNLCTLALREVWLNRNFGGVEAV